MAKLEIYLTPEQKKLLQNLSYETGKSKSELLLLGLSYWKGNPMKVEKYAQAFKSTLEIRKSKERQRQSGDFCGSFDKKMKKLYKLRYLYKKGLLRRDEYVALTKEVFEDYDRSRKAFRKSRGLEEK